MRISDSIDRFRREVKINPYFLAFLTIILATILQLISIKVGKEFSHPLLMYVMVPLITSWYGGFSPGIISTIGSIIVADYLFFDPVGSVLQTPNEVGRMLVYFLQGFIVSSLNHFRNKSELERNELFNNEIIARHDAEEAKKNREDFISITSHELKTPLTSLIAFIQLLQKQIKHDKAKQYTYYLSKIEEQTQKMRRLINDLLYISKFQLGKFEITYERVDINQCIKKVVEEFSVTGIKQTIIVHGASREEVWGDKERLIQVFTNLVSNAIKYAPEANEVFITLAENKPYIYVSVVDYGVGISKEDQKQLFTKYFRARGSGAKNYEGFGMGLFIVSEIVKLHKGRVMVASELGKGSTFTVKLPIAEHFNKL